MSEEDRCKQCRREITNEVVAESCHHCLINRGVCGDCSKAIKYCVGCAQRVCDLHYVTYQSLDFCIPGITQEGTTFRCMEFGPTALRKVFVATKFTNDSNVLAEYTKMWFALRQEHPADTWIARLKRFKYPVAVPISAYVAPEQQKRKRTKIVLESDHEEQGAAE